MKWTSVKDGLPESGQRVLVYYYDKPFELHQFELLEYFKKCDVMSEVPFDSDYEGIDRIIDLFFSNKVIKAREDGFYFISNGYRKHADCITHWMPLPELPMPKYKEDGE